MYSKCNGALMKSILINGGMFRILAAGDVLQAHHVCGDWAKLYAIWESPEGWHAAVKITGSWNKLRGEAYKTEQQALEAAMKFHEGTSQYLYQQY
jgi:hypothetical protein